MSGGPLPFALPAPLPGDAETPSSEPAGTSGTLFPLSSLRADMLLRLIRQYTESARLQSLIGVALDVMQDIDAAVTDAYTIGLDVDSAQGFWLRLLGKIVGEVPNGRTEDRFRAAIKARIAANRSQGRAEDLIKVGRLIAATDAETGARVEVQTVVPGSVEVRIDRTPLVPSSDIAAMLKRAKSAGVRLQSLHVPYPFNHSRSADFLGQGEPDPSEYTTRGLAWTGAPDSGGALVHVIG